MTRSVVAIICIFFSYVINAQEFTVELVNKTANVTSGKVHSLVFRITNTSASAHDFLPEIKLPEGLLLASSVAYSLQVEANSSKIYPISIYIPGNVESGDYKGEAFFTASNNQTVSVGFVISISPVHKLSLISLTTNNYIKSGEVIRNLFLLKNEGNSPEEVILESSIGTVIEDENPLWLQPGESKLITVTQQTFITQPKASFNQNKLTAYAKGSFQKPVFAYATTEVIPLYPKDDDIWHRFPIEISAFYLGRDQRNEYQDGFQGEIYGRGSLDENNKHEIEFRALGPDRLGLSSFSRYEEYYATYRSKDVHIHVGDKSYSSSFLTEFSRYGRGAEINMHIGKLEVGGFYNNPRFFRKINQEYNAYLKYNITKKTHLQYGYLLKETDDLIKHNIQYVTAQTQIIKPLTLKGEYAVSDSPTTEGEAIQLQGDLYLKKLNLHTSFINASPGFSGYFSNSRFFTTNARYRISPHLSLSANYRKDARNVEQDTLFGRAPYVENIQGGLTWDYHKQGRMSVFSGIREYEDLMEPKQFHYREKFSRIEFNQKLGVFLLNLEGQFANTTNYLLNTQGKTNIYSTGISFERYNTSFNLYGSYSDNSRYDNSNQQMFLYGGRINSRLSEKFQAGVFYQNTHQIEDYYTDRNLFELQLNYRITPRQEINLISRYALTQRQLYNKDLTFIFQYTLRLDVPIKRTARYGFLYGKISNLGVEKVEGIKLRLGEQTAITDTEGNFTFKNITPGTYFLEVDRQTIDIKDITDILVPVRVEIVEGENYFDFGVTRSAKIEGKVVLELSKSNGNGIKIGNRKPREQSVIIEIASEHEVFRKICEINKPFDFTWLRPGKWKMKIYRNGLDKLYKIQNDSFEFTLEPGSEQQVIIQVIKQEREIKYLQEDIKVGYSNPKK